MQKLRALVLPLWVVVLTSVATSQTLVTTVAGTGVYGFAGDGDLATEARLSLPTDVALDAFGNVYVLDQHIRRIRKIDGSTGVITTVAGEGDLPVTVDGELVGTSGYTFAVAPFWMAVDPSGRPYWASLDGGVFTAPTSTSFNLVVGGAGGDMEFDSLGRLVSTHAGLSRIDVGTGLLDSIGVDFAPLTLCVDVAGNIYYTSNVDFAVRKWEASTGQTLIVAGTGIYGHTGDGGLAVEADLDPVGLAVSPEGDLFVGTYSAIRKVDRNTGIITTVAGGMIEGDSGDGGPALDARFRYVADMVFDGDGSLLIADSENRRIRKIAGLLATHGPPTADAGDDRSVHAGESVLLDGSRSFDDNTPTENLIFTWTVVSSPPGIVAVLLDANSATPTLLVDVPGTYSIGLAVTDEQGSTSPLDLVELSSTNLAPTPSAGTDQIVVVGMPVGLDGSGTFDPEDDPITWTWTIVDAPSGSSAQILDATSATPTFSADVPGAYTIELLVSDGFPGSYLDTVMVTAISGLDFAEMTVTATSIDVISLAPHAVTNSGNQSALVNTLGQAIQALQNGNTELARKKIGDALLRTDGWPLRGAIDQNGPGRDWILDPIAQTALYADLSSALAAL